VAARRAETRLFAAEATAFPYRAIASRQAKQIRIRVGPNGVDVLYPAARPAEEVHGFLAEHSAWVVAQLERVSELPSVRLAKKRDLGTILLAGEPTAIRVTHDETWRGSNQITAGSGYLVVRTGPSAIPLERSLENWLRRLARSQIEPMVAQVASHLGLQAGRIYVRDQRTRWGSCSALGNLSFNWRLVMAPPDVLEYLVSHEVVHLVVPDHSHKFWLTLKSICPRSERARQWLAANGDRLQVDIRDLVAHIDARSAA
jgi:predicted metal-dependent hydrolase